MPLTMARTGDTNSIKKVGGKDDVRRFLESLGFVAGCPVTLISSNQGNLIVGIKDSRIAISKEMANKIIIQKEYAENEDIEKYCLWQNSQCGQAAW